tara:strand:- start:11897 stop:12931 length:1035 start_codon:yes stop_codon:yes gene_type:complete
MNSQIYNLLNDGGDHKGRRSSLAMVPLRDFLHEYGEELFSYYGEDFYVPGDEENWLNDGEVNSDTMILCMVDRSEGYKITKKDVRKKIRKAGSQRRRKIKHRYSYVNPMNRIHGYIVLKKEKIQKFPEKKIASILAIATTTFSDKRGVGSDIMDLSIKLMKECGYDNIILEASNDYAYVEEDDGEWEEEEETSSDEEENTSSDEEGGLEEDEEQFWYPTEEVLDIISHELWRKTMRKSEGSNPYYNIDKEYIWMIVNDYLSHTEEEEEEEEEEGEEGEEEEYCLSEEPEDYEYGGYWYKEGKKSQQRLIEFYEKFGFVEDPDIYLNWGCYDENPYPTMIYTVVS